MTDNGKALSIEFPYKLLLLPKCNGMIKQSKRTLI